jgi:hypothetical protein
LETAQIVSLPIHDDIRSYTLLWDSAREGDVGAVYPPGTRIALAGASMQLLRAD